jgi:hypothetical protein
VRVGVVRRSWRAHFSLPGEEEKNPQLIAIFQQLPKHPATRHPTFSLLAG